MGKCSRTYDTDWIVFVWQGIGVVELSFGSIIGCIIGRVDMGGSFEGAKWQRWKLLQLKEDWSRSRGIEGESEGLQGGKENVKLACFSSVLQVKI